MKALEGRSVLWLTGEGAVHHDGESGRQGQEAVVSQDTEQ